VSIDDAQRAWQGDDDAGLQAGKACLSAGERAREEAARAAVAADLRGPLGPRFGLLSPIEVTVAPVDLLRRDLRLARVAAPSTVPLRVRMARGPLSPCCSCAGGGRRGVRARPRGAATSQAWISGHSSCHPGRSLSHAATARAMPRPAGAHGRERRAQRGQVRSRIACLHALRR